MCLGVPGQIVDVSSEGDVRMGRVRFGGVTRRVCLEHVAEAGPGDYVLVHVGFALSRIDEAEASRIFAFLEEMGLLAELEDGDPPGGSGREGYFP